MSLREYQRKRDFAATSEPKAGPRGNGHRFVIQKHAASRLHYDFRLQIGGVLKSWAVPKGIPFAKGEKRLAVQVEDHPVSYREFEGVIPAGQYGGGTVMVWDTGTFETPSPAPAKDLASGKLHFCLEGTKLKGEWYLVRLRDESQWLLIRGGASMKPVSRKLDDTSALSGKSMSELAKNGAVWRSNRAPKPVKTAQAPATRSKKRRAPSRRAAPPGFVTPMMARLVDSAPPGEWCFEIKFDGYRALGSKGGGRTFLLSRNEKDLGRKFPAVLEAVAALGADDCLVDGEIVALDGKGRSSFQLLQSLELGEDRPPVFYYVFDLLEWNGRDLRQAPLTERREQLEKLLKKPPDGIRLSRSLGNKPEPLLRQARKLGLEGLIGKRLDSLYESGRRSGTWIKLKVIREQEFVIGGYTDPGGTRSHFGALLVGYHEDGKLRFAGKVGTGFDEARLRNLIAKFKGITRASCPFSDLPEKRRPRFGAGMTTAEMKRCHWVKPRLVGEVKFAEWTRDGKLRQPVFLGLREDKNASEVVRETPA